MRNHHSGPLGDAGARELAASGVDHRLQVSEVRRVGVDLRRQHDLAFVDHRLGVVACS
jgi:hypothetical protein